MSDNGLLTTTEWTLQTLDLLDSVGPGLPLAHPLQIVIEPDDDEYLAYEPIFSMHAAAPTFEGAKEALGRILLAQHRLLNADRAILRGHLLYKLQYLDEIFAAARPERTDYVSNRELALAA